MKKLNLHISILCFVILLFASNTTFGQSIQNKEEKKIVNRILFIFDASQSMQGRWQSDTKFNIARKLMYELLDSIADFPETELALRIYGHQFQFPPQVCSDTKLEVPFAKDNSSKIKSRLQRSNARGTTPLAYSLEQAANDFPTTENSRNIIILITDGIEECDGDPCAVSLMLQKKGIALRPFIIGIGTDFNKDFGCVGTYFDAAKEEDFKSALNVIISQVLNSTTSQVNLLDINEKPTETDVAITFYDRVSRKIMYNFMHTLNSRGLPDTLYIDPLLTYDVIAHTTPQVVSDSVTITPGMHNIVPIDVPQGLLTIKMNANSNITSNIFYSISTETSCEPIVTKQIDQTQKLLVGNYKLKIFTLPPIDVDSINIAQSHTTTVEIPEPGILVLRKNYNGDGIIQIQKNDLLQKIYTLNNKLTFETLYLQPGKYRVVFRPKNSKSTIYNVEKTFTISSGKTTDIQLY